MLGPSGRESLEERVEVLTESRSKTLEAAIVERRRIERDLHDGAQQRLVSLAMKLGMARQKLDRETSEDSAVTGEPVAKLVGEAHEEAKLALAEIRDLIRGIHPAVLTDRGLDAAISALAGRPRSPFPWMYISTNVRRSPWRSPHTSSSPKPSRILPGTPKLPGSTSGYAARKVSTNGTVRKRISW